MNEIERLEKPRTGLYRVTRPGCYYAGAPDGVPPVTGASIYEFATTDSRSVDDPRKVPAYKGDDKWWYADGANHRVENGMICRDFFHKAFFVEVPDLLEFVRQHGRCMIDIDDRGFGKIEICDE